MAPFWWAGKPGMLHLWRSKPGPESEALCGETARGWDTKPLDEHPLVADGSYGSLREWLRLYALCDECREEARRRYYPEEVTA